MRRLGEGVKCDQALSDETILSGEWCCGWLHGPEKGWRRSNLHRLMLGTEIDLSCKVMDNLITIRTNTSVDELRALTVPQHAQYASS